MNESILVIEDNAEVRDNLQELLRLSGYLVETAEDGKQGVRMARDIKPDLIICDIMMPGMDGYGVLQILSGQPETSTIPFIFLTAKTEQSDIRKGMNLGADDYITKPFEESTLLQAVQVRLEKNSRIRSTLESKSNKSWSHFLESMHGMDRLKEIADRSITRKYSKKELVFQQGDRPLYLFQIISGKVKIFQMNNDGKEITSSLLGCNDYFGYDSILRDSEFSDSAETLDDSEIRLIPREDFLNLIYSERDVASSFIRMMSDSIENKEKQLLELAYNTVRKRVADAMVRLYDTYAEKGSAAYSISISRDDLASIVGTSTESAIRMLSELKASGFIDIHGSQITILQVEKLRKVPY